MKIINYFFIEQFLRDVREGKSTMNDSCNAGTVTTNTKVWYGDFEFWLNSMKGMAKLLSIPMLEAAGYLVSTHAHWMLEISPVLNYSGLKFDLEILK